MLISSIAVLTLLLPGQCVSEPPRPWTREERRVMDATRQAERRGIVLRLGTLREIDLPAAMRTFEAAPPDLVKLETLHPGKLTLIGAALGRTTVTLSSASRQIRHQLTVVPSGPDSCAWSDWIRWLTPQTHRTPRFLLAGDQVRISGEVDSIADYRRLKNLTRSVRGLRFEVRPSAAAIEARLAKLNEALSQRGIEGARAQWRGGDYVLAPGTGSEAGALERASRLLEEARDELR